MCRLPGMLPLLWFPFITGPGMSRNPMRSPSSILPTYRSPASHAFTCIWFKLQNISSIQGYLTCSGKTTEVIPSRILSLLVTNQSPTESGLLFIKAVINGGYFHNTTSMPHQYPFPQREMLLKKQRKLQVCSNSSGLSSFTTAHFYFGKNKTSGKILRHFCIPLWGWAFVRATMV